MATSCPSMRPKHWETTIRQHGHLLPCPPLSKTSQRQKANLGFHWPMQYSTNKQFVGIPRHVGVASDGKYFPSTTGTTTRTASPTETSSNSLPVLHASPETQHTRTGHPRSITGLPPLGSLMMNTMSMTEPTPFRTAPRSAKSNSRTLQVHTSAEQRTCITSQAETSRRPGRQHSTASSRPISICSSPKASPPKFLAKGKKRATWTCTP